MKRMFLVSESIKAVCAVTLAAAAALFCAGCEDNGAGSGGGVVDALLNEMYGPNVIVLEPANCGSGCSVNYYKSGTSTNITATPGTGYTFSSWEVSAGSAEFGDPNSATTTVTATADVVITPRFVPRTYTITYDPNGGTNPTSNPSSYTYSDYSATQLQPPIRTGYTGVWYDLYRGTTGNTIPSGRTENVTLRARYTPIQYSITYYYNSGTAPSSPSNPASYTVESQTITLLPPTRTGYTFGGWYEDSYFYGDSVASIVTGSTGNTTLYAKWTINTYKITWELNDGANNPSNPTTYNITTLPTTLYSPTRDGYTFGGWYEYSDFLGYQLTTIPTGSTGDKTYYARWTLDSYIINYTFNSGMIPTSYPTSYTVEDLPITLQEPTRSGYTFDGWYSSPSFTGTAVTSIPVGSTGVKYYYAKWTINTYNIDYVLNDGTNYPSNPTNYTVTTLPITLYSPTREIGYTFGGWYTDPDFTGTAVTSIPVGSTGGKTYYAKWTATEYTINYTLNSGANHPSNPQTYTIVTPEITLQEPTRIGYTFGGWFGNSSFIGDPVTSIPYGSTGNKAYYAQWILDTYAISFDRNDGTGITETLTTGTGWMLVSVPDDPARTGYAFSGWFTSAAATGGVRVTAGVTGTAFSSDDTVYARWTEMQYSITYNLNGGANNTSNPINYTITTPTITLQAPTRPGYAFDGWYADADFTGTAVTSIPVGSTGPKTYYAKWTPATYTIKFNANGGTITPAADTIGTTDATGKLASLPTITRTGYAFDGWFTELAGGVKVTAGASGTVFGSDAALYARWTLSIYTVTFNANGGEVTPEAATTGAGWKLISLPTPARYGYTFGGWWTAATGGDTVTIDKVYSANTTIYARWTPNTYTVKFNFNGATGGTAVPDSVKTFGQAITLPNQGGWVKSGYVFRGWNTNAAGTGTNYAAGASYTRFGDATLYAKWVLSCTVTFSENGADAGTAPTAITGDSGVAITLPLQGGLGRTDYFFGGWNTEDDGAGTNYGPGASYTPSSGSVILYAKWSQQYTVTFDLNGGSGTPIAPISVDPGDPITIPPGTGLTPPNGKTFGGWNTNTSGIGTNYNAGDSYTPTGNITTLYAKWTAFTSVNYSYTGSAQQVTLQPGTYLLEVWGANGGDGTFYSGSSQLCNGVALTSVDGGKGGYSYGVITVTTPTTFNVVVGGKGATGSYSISGGYNGGGNGTSTQYTSGSGGGATHIATATGLLSTLSGNKAALIMVAGGGGGGGNTSIGGHGGGTTGVQPATSTQFSCRIAGGGGTQSAVGASYSGGSGGGFGQGSQSSQNNAGGGGGGLYGGGCGENSTGGGGGSGYLASALTNSGTRSANDSGFTANPDASGNGYVRITLP